MASFSEDLKEQILNFLIEKREEAFESYSIYELMSLFKKSRTTVYFVLKELIEQNKIDYSKSSTDGYKTHWYYHKT